MPYKKFFEAHCLRCGKELPTPTLNQYCAGCRRANDSLKSLNRARKSWEKYKERREALIDRLSNGECQICHTKTSRLELHHLSYYLESFTNRADSNLKEAEKYPERFMVLCYRCHKIVTWYNQNPNLKQKIDEYFQHILTISE